MSCFFLNFWCIAFQIAKQPSLLCSVMIHVLTVHCIAKVQCSSGYIAMFFRVHCNVLHSNFQCSSEYIAVLCTVMCTTTVLWTVLYSAMYNRHYCSTTIRVVSSLAASLHNLKYRNKKTEQHRDWLTKDIYYNFYPYLDSLMLYNA